MIRILAATVAAVFLVGCGAQDARDPYAPSPYVKLAHAEWAKDAVLYELNIRQFTPEGTFTAAQKQLPRLKALGVDIIWLMPIHEIGVKNRKGLLGSPYSVKDYYSVNPEFGTLDDLKAFVADAHRLGFHVILDWVANHTSRDNSLIQTHPDWYVRDAEGNLTSTPWLDWSDIVDLDYRRPGLRKYMIDAMKYWVRDVGVDGFRCDVAGYVPLDFWVQARRALDRIKPVFMLAEWESRDLHARAFDASYAWSWNNAMHDIAVGKADVGALTGYYAANTGAWPHDAYRMTYVSNHDQNAWDSAQYERFKNALKPAIVLSVVGEGIPLLYNGQEAGNRKRLAFFAKDPIDWRKDPIGDLYTSLFALKHQVTALWNGAAGARMAPVANSQPSKALSFLRANKKDGVFAVFNLSAESLTVTFQSRIADGQYVEYFTHEAVTVDEGYSLTMAPWGYRVFVRR